MRFAALPVTWESWPQNSSEFSEREASALRSRSSSRSRPSVQIGEWPWWAASRGPLSPVWNAHDAPRQPNIPRSKSRTSKPLAAWRYSLRQIIRGERRPVALRLPTEQAGAGVTDQPEVVQRGATPR